MNSFSLVAEPRAERSLIKSLLKEKTWHGINNFMCETELVVLVRVPFICLFVFLVILHLFVCVCYRRGCVCVWVCAVGPNYAGPYYMGDFRI